MRQLLIPLRSPVALALVPILLLLIPEVLNSISGFVVELSFDAFNKGFMPIQETIIVMGFSVALVRSKPHISFVSVTTIATIFFAALIIGELTSIRGVGPWS